MTRFLPNRRSFIGAAASSLLLVRRRGLQRLPQSPR